MLTKKTNLNEDGEDYDGFLGSLKKNADPSDYPHEANPDHTLTDLQTAADKWKKLGYPDKIANDGKSKNKADKGRSDKCGK
jgi:hypothetical protein